MVPSHFCLLKEQNKKLIENLKPNKRDWGIYRRVLYGFPSFLRPS